MKKEMLKEFICALVLFLIVCPFYVNALPTGENYSESATKKYELGRFYWNSGSMALYGHNGTGNSIYDPQLQRFRNGTYSLYTYGVDQNSSRSGNYTIGFNFNYGFEPTHTYEAYISIVTATSEFNYYFASVSSLHEADILNIDSSCSYNQECVIYIRFKPRKAINVLNLNYDNFSGHSGLDAKTFDELIGALYFPQITDLGVKDTSINDNKDEILNNSDFNKNQIIQNNDKNKNEIIDNQNKNQQQTNEKLDETNDFLKDDTPPEADISSLGNVQGLLPPGPVDSLLNIPFYFLSILTSSLGGVCTPLSGNFVFDTTLSIPCFSEMIYTDMPEGIMVFINLIPTTFLLIVYFKHLYKKVSRAVSLETTGDDEWGVL